jgi:hypothetical protein
MMVTDPGKHYVALGDSMSIDDYAGGEGRGAASLLFVNDDERFPDWRGRDLVSAGRADKFVQLARDGSTSSDVAGSQLAALGGLEVVPVALTVSIGGNDLLSVFGDTRRPGPARLVAPAPRSSEAVEQVPNDPYGSPRS